MAEPCSTNTTPPAGAGESRHVSTGLRFRPAGGLSDVLAAWQLVYNSYRRIDLVPPNRYRIHTSTQAVGPQSAVISGQIGPLTVTTLTAIEDGPAGLPLDRVYHEELAHLRAQGRRMMEVGLFADRRENLTRHSEALLQLMRYVWHWGRQLDVSDFIIGVHPRHARFYSRAFGFEQFAEETTYEAVNDHPVVLLRGEPAVQLQRDRRPRGIQYFIENPIDLSLFERRYLFPDDEVAASLIGRFLTNASGAGAAGQAA